MRLQKYTVDIGNSDNFGKKTYSPALSLQYLEINQISIKSGKLVLKDILECLYI